MDSGSRYGGLLEALGSIGAYSTSTSASGMMAGCSSCESSISAARPFWLIIRKLKHQGHENMTNNNSVWYMVYGIEYIVHSP